MGAVDAAAPVEPDLDQIISFREQFLTGYQNQALAQRYRRFVERAIAAEQALGGSGTFAKAVAEAYFKLLAYKDEYEVARLYTRPEFRAALDAQFADNPRLRLHLAPPFLARRDPDTGEPQKREFGGWILGVFRVLAKFKFLRGTRLDPFGYAEERRFERQLIADYEATVDELISDLRSEQLTLATEVAELPLSIRGFGHVKQRNADIAANRQRELLQRLEAPTQTVQIVDPATLKTG